MSPTQDFTVSQGSTIATPRKVPLVLETPKSRLFDRFIGDRLHTKMMVLGSLYDYSLGLEREFLSCCCLGAAILCRFAGNWQRILPALPGKKEGGRF